MTAHITIERLLIHARHGVMEQERLCGNEFEVTVEMDVAYDGSDAIGSTVNYAEVISLIQREMAVPSQLIEHVACRIGRAIRREFPAVAAGTVCVAKLRPPVSARPARVAATIPF